MENINDKLPNIEFRKALLFQQIFGGFLHDNRHILSSLFFCVSEISSIVEKEYPGNKRINERLDRVIELCKNLDDNFRSIYDFYRSNRDGDFKEIKLSDVITHSLQLIESRTRREKVEIRFLNSNEYLTIQGNLEELSHCILNVIINSLDAFQYGIMGVIDILIEQDNQFKIIKIRDNGIGINPEYINKITDPLFTTKSDAYGFGLSIVKQIIENKYGGELVINSNVGKWTEVQLKFKLDERPN